MTETAPTNQNYLVLARKYRSQTFGELIGQDALVRTLTNAIASGRLHHAYIFTGIRGTGKTSTARLLAKALNCNNGPSVDWAADDRQCAAIATGRHVDVLEFDAASHTGVDDIRELFEGVAYAPVQGQYKVYIIDEVHMLSKQAFNALLKTLEEPPEHVKFIFATTEVHKVPVTVLSRCQRFDLRRVPAATLADHFTGILQKEGLNAEDGAIRLVARAADGSVRDGLSLLDQAMALAGNSTITEELVAGMLGLADRTQVYDLFEAIMAGQPGEALGKLAVMYAHGHDPLLLIQDLLQLTHLLTRLKIVPDLASDPALTELERGRGAPLAKRMHMENLSRVYQMLLTAAAEIRQADRPFEALEMACMRLCHLAPLPAVAQLLAQAGQVPPAGAPAPAASEQEPVPPKKPQAPAPEAVSAPTAPQVDNAPLAPQVDNALPAAPVGVPEAQPDKPLEQANKADTEETPNPLMATWARLVAGVKRNQPTLGAVLEQQARPVTVNLADHMLVLDIRDGLHSAQELQRDLRSCLNTVDGEADGAWSVNLAVAPLGAETLSEVRAREARARIAKAMETPEVRRILEAFPGAKVVRVAPETEAIM